MRRLAAAFLPLQLATAMAHEAPANAHYLANEGVMVEQGETRVLFDPLFNEDFGQYRLLPADLREALIAGKPPYDGIDAVFISHYHDDHFAPADVVEYLRAQPSVRLFAPEQAAAALREAAGAQPALLERVTAVGLQVGDEPRRFELPGLVVEAVRIPHAGWPSRLLDVENLAWRVTLVHGDGDGDGPTVLHLGDADTRDMHFARDAHFWEQRRLHLALPPYWYFLSDDGRVVLEERLRPAHAVGIHVPVSVPENPAEREPALREVDLFTRPGETRRVPDHRQDVSDEEPGRAGVQPR